MSREIHFHILWYVGVTGIQENTHETMIYHIFVRLPNVIKIHNIQF